MLSTTCAQGQSAEFDLDAGRTILRRLQYCGHCGSALLVTHVHAGVMVRCPDCGKEQPRLADKYLLTQLYQTCRLCYSPLDTEGKSPGDPVECDTCKTKQYLTRDAFPAGDNVSGLGYVPGFPPGSGKKVLLYSRENPDAPITAAPLDSGTGTGTSEPISGYAPFNPPRPPKSAIPDAVRHSSPPVADISPGIPPGRDSRTPTHAVDVPAVSTDLFGGRRAGLAVENSDVNAIAAKVDGKPIYVSEIRRIVSPALERLKSEFPEADSHLFSEKAGELSTEVLNRLIDRELALAEAERMGLTPNADMVRTRETELRSMGLDGDVRRDAERDVIMADVRRAVANKPASVSPEMVRTRYQQTRDKMPRPRHIAIAPLIIYQDRAGRADRRDYKAIAGEVSLALERGERFDALSGKHDEFAPTVGIEAAAPQLQPESHYSEQILQAAGSLRKGAVFGPLFMDGMAMFGKVVDERPAGPVPFEEVEKEIRKRLEAEAEEQAFGKWLGDLRRKAKIEIFP